MIKNLLLVALRNFKRDKWYSFLNIFGLTIGITFSILLIFYIRDELSYDRYNVNADRIVRINAYIQEKDKPEMRWASTPFPLGPALKKDYPEVEESVRFVGTGKVLMKQGTRRFYEDKIFITDSNVFRVFPAVFIEGDPRTALLEPKSLVLTRALAEKYFGKSKSCVGKFIQNDKGEIYKVTAVVQDLPTHSHLIYRALVSRSTLPPDFASNWGSFNFYCYVLLRPHTNVATFQQKLLPMYDRYLASIFRQFNVTVKFVAQPITSIHLHSTVSGEPEELGSISYIYIFSAVALFMLLIACINYMNLTTARSARRAREIGIRKVSGSTRRQLVAQFLAESVLTTLFALLLSIGLLALLLPSFNSIAGKDISFFTIAEPGTLGLLVGVVVFVGLVAGSYPAFYLASFNPVGTLKGNLSKGSGHAVLRRSLVVLQFSISMVMLICTWVVYTQLRFLRNVDLGFNKEQVLLVNAYSDEDLRSRITGFMDAARKMPQVLSAATAQNYPGSGNMNFNLFSVETASGYKDQGISTYAVDERYLETLGIQLKQGRNFTGLSDTLHGALVNENLVKFFKWDNPVGKRIKFPGDTSGRYLQVAGVIKDFNQQSLYNAITPLLITYSPHNYGMLLKLSPQNITGSIAGIRQLWQTSFPNLPFAYTFLDQDFDSQYAADQKRGKIFMVFSILTILITCLGLLGLVAFTTQQRQKEISIRKILGAGTGTLVPLITNGFMALVGLSCLIAFPVAWLFMDKWLNVFPYNSGLTIFPFLLSGLSVLVITMLTVIFHTVKAALANPVVSLRTE